MVRNECFSTQSVHKDMQIISNEMKLGMKIVWEIKHLIVVLTRLWLTVWRHKQRLNLALKFNVLFFTQKSA